MSGIVAILEKQGRPVDADVLARLTMLMAPRGPDGLATWSAGAVGFGHALLRVVPGSAEEPIAHQDGVSITADARIDGRGELVRKLDAGGRRTTPNASDAHLVLQAYLLWGDACIEHLLGDFAFAIWDERRQVLFCACDHLGVKPLYFADTPTALVLSNTFECVLAHPGVSRTLDEHTVGDFLLFGENQDLSRTTFADVKQLPPASSLTVAGGTTRTQRYWTLPIEPPRSFRTDDECLEQFDAVLREAVGDRIRGLSSITVFMSGGLDSTAVASAVRRIAPAVDVRAITVVYDRLIADDERHYTSLAADALGIPVTFMPADAYTLYDGFRRPELYSPEPVLRPLRALIYDQFAAAATHGPVVLTGDGGDGALYRASPANVARQLRSRDMPALVKATVRYALSHGRLPEIGVRTAVRAAFSRPEAPPPLPGWLRTTFADRVGLRDRWIAVRSGPDVTHPYRDQSYRGLVHPRITNHLRSCYDTGLHLPALEGRHPLYDIRVLSFLMSLPSVPWCIDKELLRRSAVGILPPAVRTRRKTPLVEDIVQKRLARAEDRQALDFTFDALGDRVDVPAYRAVIEEYASGRAMAVDDDTLLAPVALNGWLRSVYSVPALPPNPNSASCRDRSGRIS